MEATISIASLVAKTEDFLLARNGGEKRDYSREEMRAAAEVMVRMFAPALPAEEQEGVLDRVCRELQTRFTTVISPSHYLTAHDCRNWLTEERKRSIMSNGFWESYRASLTESRGKNMADKIDEDTDKILGFMADPGEDLPQQKKGLVIGDVQSGKTSNYAGLICKAADAGYKVIIVIAGTISTLRAQTQERLEKDFVGKSSNDNIAAQYRNKPYGVSRFRTSEMKGSVSILTKWNYDFRRSDAEQIAPGFRNGNIALLVIQKNARTLSNVITFLRTRLSDAEKARLPLLVLDDEADNASPNTRADETPSTINQHIRTILSLFKINSYVGYTATPYANIFINPDVEPMEIGKDNIIGQELFPRDFIYCIGHSEEYIGAARLFTRNQEESAEYDEVQYNVQTIGEESEFLEALGEGRPTEMPDSLATAINTFVITKAIRSIREDADFHCSMLIHVTLKKDGHTRVKAMVDEYCRRLLSAVSQYIALPNPEEEDACLKALHDTWLEQFEDTDITETWEKVCSKMAEPGFTEGFRIYKENSSTHKKLRLDYSKASGLTAIVIGGNGLARGLTLEGLCTSYFLRNSRQYDTLMQMGRWFGYRPHYADICRIFLSQRMQDHFAAIAQATDELKESVGEMLKEDKTPLEFGLRVRNGVSGLIITSPNKMKSANCERREEWIDFSDSLCETYKVPSDEARNRLNKQALLEFVAQLDAGYARYERKDDERQYGVLWEQIPAAEAVGFLDKTKGMGFSSDPFAVSTLKKHLMNRHEKIDVALIVSDQEGARGIVKTAVIGGTEYRIPWRVPSARDGDYYFTKNHPFSKIHELGCLKKSVIETLKQHYVSEHPECRQDASRMPLSNMPGKYYRRAEGRRPLLMLALIAVPEPDVANAICEKRAEYKKRHLRYTEKPTPELLSRTVAVWGVSFPKGDSEAQKVVYTVNKVQLKTELAERERLEQEADEEY